MPPSILATKIAIPKSRPQIVPRERLIVRLNEGLEGKLTLISALAGFGKTTLASAWARTLLPSAAWLSLDESDDDIIRCLTYVVAALQTVDESIGAEAIEGLRHHHFPAVEELLISILNQFCERSQPLVLFLDDYHFITTPAIHEMVFYLLDHMPAHMHIVIISRADPSLPISRLRARAELHELRQADLQFTPEEAADFFRQVMALSLEGAEVQALHARTEGWAAGLQLAALSLRSKEDASAFVRKIAISNRYILDYLMEEVLEDQPQQVKEFLLQTSILERMSAALCAAVVVAAARLPEDAAGTSLPNAEMHAQAALEQLESANLFLIPLDDSRTWYRYHRLFRNLLQKELGQSMPDLIPGFHQRASVWYAQNGMLPDAINHALKGHDFFLAAEMIETIADDMLKRSEVGTMRRWLVFPCPRLFSSRLRFVC